MAGLRIGIAAALLCGVPHAWAQAPADARPVLVLTGAVDTYNTFGLWLTLIYTDALGRLGYRLHPELVKVPVAHFTINFVAYAARPLTLGNGWPALKETAFRVEYRSGVALPGAQLPLVVPPERLTVADSSLLGLRKLQVGRSDVFVEVEQVAEPLLATEEFRNTTIRKIAMLETADVHAHLNKRHADLAQKLGQVLADMKKDGLIEKYRQQAGIPKQP